jgi:hypothetical protein
MGASATGGAASVEIIKLAAQENLEGLRAFVPASAKFNMGEHDVIMEIGDGPAGAVAFAKGLRVSGLSVHHDG